MNRVIRAEALRLFHWKSALIAIAATLTITVAIIWLTVANLSDDPRAALSAARLAEAEGGVRLAQLALAFANIPLLAVFVTLSASPFNRGTWRTSLLQQPRRLLLATGQLLARFGFVSMFMLTSLFGGLAAAWLLAENRGIDTSAWFTATAWGDTAEAAVRVLGMTFVSAVIGTLLGVVTRSIPIALGIGLIWFGPIENAIGDNLSWADDWFPGLLMRWLMSPGLTEVSQTHTNLTLAAYLLVAMGMIGWVLHRRDVTS